MNIQPARTLVKGGDGGQAVMLDPIATEPYVYPMLLGSDYQPVADLDERFPGAKYTRVYGPHGMPGAAALNAVPAGVELVHASFHGATDQAAVRASLTAARRPGRFIITETLHEPNRAVKNGGPTPAAYHANYDLLAEVVRDLDPHGDQLGLVQTMMGWAARHLTGDRAWKNFIRKDVDFVGVDLEWDSESFGTTAYPAPAPFQAIALAIRDYAGKPLIYPEFAWRRLSTDPSGIGCGQFYRRQVAYAQAQEVFAMAIYDTNGTTGAYRLLDGSPELAVARELIG